MFHWYCLNIVTVSASPSFPLRPERDAPGQWLVYNFIKYIFANVFRCTTFFCQAEELLFGSGCVALVNSRIFFEHLPFSYGI